MPKKKVQTEQTNKGKELFDFLNGITTDQSKAFFDNLTDVEKKKYKTSRYMIHRFLSMNVNYAQVVNALQQYSNIPDKAHYQFLTGMLPKGKQYNKYIKGDKDERYEAWLVQLVAKHYSVSTVEASQYLDILYSHNKEELKTLCKSYGIDDKQIKKLKL
jgi:formate dehydrogenase maturation protein FdhE